jgi:hypothetical protein
MTLRFVLLFAIGLSASVTLTACGGSGLPPASVASLSSARGAVRAAQEVGAEEVPRAALHLKHARDQIAAAERMLEDGQDVPAQRMFMRAEADAEVALALARHAAAESEAEQAATRLSAARRAAAEEAP